MDRLTPKDHAEAVALFRSEIVGALVRRELDRGELRALLRSLAQERFRPPASPRTRSHRLPQTGVRLTYCHNATLGRRDFYRQLCVALGLSPSATAAAVFYAVSTHVQELGRDRVYPVFLLDEAHLLHQDTLDHLHILLNYEWDSRALLSLVLVGLPELSDRLEPRRNRSLYSRLHRRLHIEPLTVDDTGAYVRLRLRQAGCDRELFSQDAIALIHETALGTMRDIDRLATNALRESVHAFNGDERSLRARLAADSSIADTSKKGSAWSAPTVTVVIVARTSSRTGSSSSATITGPKTHTAGVSALPWVGRWE
jgi:type II secretory pathway predicted ATPase ExeA